MSKPPSPDYYASLRFDFDRLLALSASHLTPEQRSGVIAYVGAAEFGVALELLCGVFVQAGIKPGGDMMEVIDCLRRRMGLAKSDLGVSLYEVE